MGTARRIAAIVLLFGANQGWSGGITVDSLEADLNLRLSSELYSKLAPLLKKYRRAKGHKAVSVLFNDNGDFAAGVSAEAPSEVAAALLASQQCNAYRDKFEFPGQCEVMLLNTIVIPLGASLRREIDKAGPSLVWRVEGTQGTVYLAGTLHIMKPTLYPLPDVFDLVFSKATQIALEANVLLSSKPSRVDVIRSLASGEPVAMRSSMHKSLRKALHTYVKQQGGDIDAVYQVKPAFLALQISQLNFAALGFTSAFGIEHHFAQRAVQANKSILELEHFSKSLEVLINVPLAVQNKMLASTLSQRDQAMSNIHKLITLWMSGDVDRLHSLLQDTFAGDVDLELIGQELLDKRNANMLASIESYLAADETTFVMVGAAHLGGENGLLALLAQKGVAVTRLLNNGQDGLPMTALPVNPRVSL